MSLFVLVGMKEIISQRNPKNKNLKIIMKQINKSRMNKFPKRVRRITQTEYLVGKDIKKLCRIIIMSCYPLKMDKMKIGSFMNSSSFN